MLSIRIITVFVTFGSGFPVVFCVSTSLKASLYKGKTDQFLQDTFSSFMAASEMTCCLNCEQSSECKSVNFHTPSKTCEFSKDSLVAVGVNAQADPNWSIYSKDEWALVFRATPGVGGDVYTAWKDGVNVTSDDVTCMTTDVTSCSQHYRNPIVDSWTAIVMSEVKFALYRSNVEVAYIIFDGRGSDVENWFSKTRIVQSSWENIKTESYNIFSIIGHQESRRFMINHVHFGCLSDSGYTVVINFEAHPCIYDSHLTYPQFLYANSTTFGMFGTLTGMRSMVLSSAVILFLLYVDISTQTCPTCSCCKDNACDVNNNCIEGCIEGYWGDQCTESCRENCKICTSENTCTECRQEYWGNQCTSSCGKGCANNTCLQSGTCTCKSTNFKEGLCNICSGSNKYGDECNYTCPTNCGACQSQTECRWCKHFMYFGSYCQFDCSVGCIQGKCKKDGRCQNGCNPGFTGEKCDSCVSGKHGPSCDLNCPGNCTVCLSSSNCTECTLGYYGSTCTNMCPYGCYEDVCDMDGMCTQGCKTGLNTTTNCVKCEPSNWGDSCQYKCPEKCASCTSNEDCTKCVEGYYGPKCSAQCPTFCLDSVCKDNGECYSCQERHFGVNCQSECSKMCQNRNCSRLNGNCLECPQGFYGDFCNRTTCKDGFYGKICTMVCNHRDVDCLTCLTNESGMYGGCTKCTPGNYPSILIGFNHTECTQCPVECKDKTCDPSDGHCTVGCYAYRKHGDYCLQNCSRNCNNQTCDWKTGQCSNGCVDNHYGLYCESKCASTCRLVSGKSVCNYSNGNCISDCEDGFHGEKCDKTCSDKCANTTCLRKTGQCSNGCIEGFGGSQCAQEIKGPESEDDNLIVIVGAAAGAGVAVIVIVVLSVVCIIKRRRRKGTGANESNTANGKLKHMHEKDTLGELQAEDKDAAQPNNRQGSTEHAEDDGSALYDTTTYDNPEGQNEYYVTSVGMKMLPDTNIERLKRQMAEDANTVYDTTYDNPDRNMLKGINKSDTTSTGLATEKGKPKRQIVDDANTVYDTTVDNKNKKMLNTNNEYDVFSAGIGRSPNIDRNNSNRVILKETNAVYDTTSGIKNKKMFNVNNEYGVLSAGSGRFLNKDRDNANGTILDETNAVYDTTSGNKNKKMFNVNNDYDVLSAGSTKISDTHGQTTYAKPDKTKLKIVEETNPAYDSTYDR